MRWRTAYTCGTVTNIEGVTRSFIPAIHSIKSEVTTDDLSGVLISEDAAESLVRCFLPDIVSFFESDAGRKEFEEWDKDWDKLKEIE